MIKLEVNNTTVFIDYIFLAFNLVSLLSPTNTIIMYTVTLVNLKRKF